MSKGYAPCVVKRLQVGGRKTLEFHHRNALKDIGYEGLYDLSNLELLDPLTHINIHRTYP